MKKTGIYKITSPTGNIYVGQSVDIIKRWNRYKYNLPTSQQALCSSFVKHGFENHKFEILIECEVEKLNNLEIYYITLFDCFNTDHGLNLRTGGTSRNRFSEQARKRLSIAAKNKIVTDVTKEKIRQNRLKQADPRLGKKHTEETKALISKNRTGIFPNRIYTCSQETRDKISQGNMGHPAWNKGISPKPETLAKMKIAQLGTKRPDSVKKQISETLKRRYIKP